MSRQQTVAYRSRYNGWSPPNPEVRRAFLKRHVYGVTLRDPIAWNTWATDFINTIQASSVMEPLLELVFEQVNKDDKWAASDEKYRVRDIEHLRKALASVTQGPPEVYVVTNEQNQPIGEPIGVPIYLILDLLSNTSAAHDLFRLKEFNAAMETFLNHWHDYLEDTVQEPRSNSTLNETDSGWFGPYGLQVLEQGLKGQTFEATYGVNPAQAQRYYKSWDKFFVRDFADIAVARPVVQVTRFPAIYNVCESTSIPIPVAQNVKLYDKFWLKDQKYSLYDMFGGNSGITPESLSNYASNFVGGTVYQAFLSPQDYHHWHSPVKGTVVAVRRIPGTYYAVLPDNGAPADDPDLQEGDPHGAIIRSQPWLSVAATRGVTIIKPDAASQLDWVAVIAIGMVEVSTIEFSVSENSSVEAGDHMGMFHFGGSSHTLIVKPKEGYKVEFKDLDGNPISGNQHHWVRSVIGRVVAA